jgi:hypothetical protein
MTIIQVSNQSVPTARQARQRCDHCGGPFGLVTHRWWGSKFCKRSCKDAHIREIMLDHRWYGLLAGLSLQGHRFGTPTLPAARKDIAMVPQFAWNCSRRLRTLICALLIASLSGSFSNLEAGYCGQSLDDFRAARIRWANTRQTAPRSEEPAQICRAYGNEFYEAVEARHAVSQCEGGAARQKDIDALDAEIEAFNSLIAIHCGT